MIGDVNALHTSFSFKLELILFYHHIGWSIKIWWNEIGTRILALSDKSWLKDDLLMKGMDCINFEDAKSSGSTSALFIITQAGWNIATLKSDRCWLRGWKWNVVFCTAIVFFLYNSSIRLLALLMDISVLVEAGLRRVYGVLYVLHYSFQIDVLEKVVFVKLWWIGFSAHVMWSCTLMVTENHNLTTRNIMIFNYKISLEQQHQQQKQQQDIFSTNETLTKKITLSVFKSVS